MGRKRNKRGNMGTRPLTQVDKAMGLNAMAYNIWFEYLMGLTLSSIVWDNLPNDMPEMYMETVLAEQGYILFFYDEILENYVCLPCTIGGRLNVYRVPIHRVAYAPNGYNKHCNMENSVIIFNNYMHTPSMMVIEYYARRLSMQDRAIDVNVNSQKYPMFIKTSKQQELTMRNMYEQYEGNCPIIFGSDDFDLDAITTIQTGAPYVADKMETTKHHIFNDFLTWLGVENSNQDKKERMTVNEVGSNYGNVEMSRNMRLNARLQACKQIKELFGYEMTCRFNSDLQTLVNIGREMIDEDVQVYNSSEMDNRTSDTGL